jgi:hypothetical protein
MIQSIWYKLYYIEFNNNVSWKQIDINKIPLIPKLFDWAWPYFSYFQNVSLLVQISF